MPTYYFDSNASYLIAGGLGGLGRCIARWMVSRRAKHLILLSHKSVHAEPVMAFLDEMRTKGITVATPTCDMADEHTLEAILKEVDMKMPLIKGCIQASLVLKNGELHDMPIEDFQSTVRPKFQGSWNLHKLLPTGMNFFILLSSIVGILGGLGQANYAAGNTYQDTLASHRTANGEKAVAIDLGMVLSVGFVAERENVKDYLTLQGYIGIREAELLAMMDYYCDSSLSVLSLLKSQVVTGVGTPAILRSKRIAEPYWMKRPMFRHLEQIENPSSSSSGSGSNSAGGNVDWETLLSSAASVSDAGDIICDALATKLSTALAIPRKDIDMNEAVHSFGVDSLMAVELRNWFFREVRANVAVFEILGNGSMVSLGVLAAGKSAFVPSAVKEREKEKEGER
ncbi:MAG: hypothetical protein MMC33_005398 [Icmadophila ericetorum]|nr:hypothetical protein [Icmadophila ericetorum]